MFRKNTEQEGERRKKGRKLREGESQGCGLRQAFSAFPQLYYFKKLSPGMTCRGAVRIFTHQPHFQPVVPDKRIKDVRQ